MNFLNTRQTSSHHHRSFNGLLLKLVFVFALLFSASVIDGGRSNAKADSYMAMDISCGTSCKTTDTPQFTFGDSLGEKLVSQLVGVRFRDIGIASYSFGLQINPVCYDVYLDDIYAFDLSRRLAANYCTLPSSNSIEDTTSFVWAAPAAGSFAVPQLRQGQHTISVRRLWVPLQGLSPGWDYVSTFNFYVTQRTGMVATGGTPQSTTVQKAFPVPLQVTVRDDSGAPASNVTVTFAAPSSNATAKLSSQTATTDGNGVASVTATASGYGGSYVVTATVSGGAAPVFFSLVNAGTPARIITLGGTPQSGSISLDFPVPLQVMVTDDSGNPTSGVEVTFVPMFSSNHITSATIPTAPVKTNASGIVGVIATANNYSGTYEVWAIIDGGTGPAIFTLSNYSTLTYVKVASGTPQSAQVTQPYSVPLKVTVTDDTGAPAGGILVSFFAPTSGASAALSSQTARTDTQGNASITATANGLSGNFAVTAWVSGISTPASFALSNLVPPTVTSVSPAKGITAGGTSITISGTGFIGTPAVTIGGIAAQNIAVVSATSITANTPAGTAGPASVIVTTAGGSNAANTLYAYVAVPLVTTQPAPVTVTVGNTASFTAAASVSPTPTIQWQVSKGGGTFTDIASATSPRLSFTPVVGDSGNNYRAVFTNAGGVVNSNSAVLIVNKANQTIAFGTLPGPLLYSPSAQFAVTASATSSLMVSYSILGATNVCSISGSTVTVLSAGICTVSADQPGNVNYNAAPQVTQAITIGKASQIVSLADPGPKTYAPGGTFSVSAMGGASDNAITFTSTTSGVCTVTGSIVSMVSAGTCTITANQLGNGNYQTATQVAQNIVIGQATQIITLGANPGPLTYSVGGSFNVSATGGASGKVITFTSTTSGVCTVTGSAVSMVSAGTCIIAANQLGNGNYQTATQVVQNILIDQATQVITFGANPGPLTYSLGGSFNVSATGGASGNAVTFASTTTGICTVTGSTVSMIGAGTCTISANQLGNGNYQTAAQVLQNSVIGQATQIIAFGANPGPLTYSVGGSFNVSATGGASGNAVTFASTTTGICNITGSTVRMIGAGTCTITANQLGNANYQAATQVMQNIVIGKAAQTVVFTSTAPTAPLVTGSYTPTATGGLSTSPVVLSIDTASGANVCAIDSSNKVNFMNAGNCIIDVNQAGDANYSAAPQMQQSLSINKIPVVIGAMTSDLQTAVIGQTVNYTVFLSLPRSASLSNSHLFAAINPVLQVLALNTTAPPILSGTVDFFDQGTNPQTALCVGVAVMNGQATCAVKFGAAGSHNVVAVYNGTQIFASATKATVTAIVNQAGPNATAIGSFMSDRANQIVTNLFGMDRQIDRLNQAQQIQQGSSSGSSTHYMEDIHVGASLPSLPTSRLGAGPTGSTISAARLPASSATSAIPDAYGIEAMLYGAMQNAGQSGQMNGLSYSGAFDLKANFQLGLNGSFKTSLSQMLAFQKKVEQQDASALGLSTSRSSNTFMPLDIWAEGTYATYNGTRSGQFGMVSVGSDYVFNPNALVGVFAQIDTMNQTSGTAINGTGWMFGPYTTLRLNENLFWQARAAWGQSNNSISPSGSPTSQFGSTRWLASSSVSGKWKLNEGWSFAPTASFAYFTDRSDSYIDGFGVSIPSAQTQLGQFKLSPELSYAFTTEAGFTVEPTVATDLIWNVVSTNVDGFGALSDASNGPVGLRGRLQAGLNVRTPSGISIGATGSYDGIGSGA